MELEDLFYYDPSWRIIVCKQCGVVPQTNIARHIRRHHNPTRAFRVAAIKLFERSFDHLPLIRDAGGIKGLAQAGLVRTPVSCQTLFHGSRCRYFIVEARKVHNDMEENPSGFDAGSSATNISPAFAQTGLEDIINLQLAQQEKRKLSNIKPD
ncbi:hypothetical protein FOMA001_g18458 [Fusarium oxysporum f. sp. matthiolae]|nr:hypothetical protein FOMA001_g18458 [Fusarium oxysporum f. sp. matthiolae]